MEPVRLRRATYRCGAEGKKKPIFSVNAHRREDLNLLFLGIHGSTIVLEMSDEEVDIICSQLREVRNAGSV